MSFKWNDTTERMMLIMFVAQNPTLKFDADAALNTWPSNLAAPTKRSIGDRFRLVKQQFQNGNLTSSLGIGGTIRSTGDAATSALSVVPATPRSLNHKKAKTDHNHDNGAASCPPLSSRSAHPAKNTKSTSSAKFTSRLHAAARDAKNGKKRKRKENDSEEDSMSSHGSETESGDGDDMNDKPAATGSRRSLPRRSKSKTPVATYRDGNSTPSEGNEDSDDDDDEQDVEQVSGACVKHEAVESGDDADDDEDEDENQDEEDSDDEYDQASGRAGKEDHQSKKRKMTWQERIAKIDVGDQNDIDKDDEDDDDMQD